MERLKSLRKEKNMSQQKLAKQIGTNQQNIHRYEHGFYEPDITTLKLLANFFNTSIDYLVGNTEIWHKIEPVESFDLNELEANLVKKYRDLPGNAKRGVNILVNELADENK